MSTIEIAFKHSGHNHFIRDVSESDAAYARNNWMIGKGRVIEIGPFLYARDSIAWVRITEEPPRPGVWVQGADSWVKIAD